MLLEKLSGCKLLILLGFFYLKHSLYVNTQQRIYTTLKHCTITCSLHLMSENLTRVRRKFSTVQESILWYYLGHGTSNFLSMIFNLLKKKKAVNLQRSLVTNRSLVTFICVFQSILKCLTVR